MWRLALKAGVSAALLWLMLRHQDFGALLGQIAAVSPGALLAAFALAALGVVALALRWLEILRALGAPRKLRMAVPLILIGRFFSQALPSGMGGDVMRVWLSVKAGLPTAISISSVLADRLVGLFAILLIVTAEIPTLLGMSLSPAVTQGIMLVLIAGYGGFVVLMALDRLPQHFHRFRIIRGFRQFARDLRAVLLSPRPGTAAITCGLLVQAFDVLIVFALARGLGLTASLSDCFVVVPLSNLVQALPISIAGWGIRESFFVAAFGMIGIRAPDALAVSILFGMFILVTSLPGGVLWLLQKSGDAKQLGAAAAEPADAKSVVGS
jgi:glycosyltransferase 2 family protein